MPALEHVSVISDLKGTKECKNREKTDNSAVINRVLVHPQGIYINTSEFLRN